LERAVIAPKGLGSPVVTIDRDVDMKNQSTHPRQVAVIPARRGDDGAVQVCLIRRKNSAKWGIPKGYIEPGDDWRQAALGEAHEEAGLDGRLIGEIIGTYEYEKGPLTLTVAVCVMEVLEVRTTWREMQWRERRWCSIEEAGALLKDHRVWALYNRIRPSLVTMSPNLYKDSPSQENKLHPGAGKAKK
jgi:8-oxo-dGTP pyrophosphatase MutT (NUDIX family)